MPPAAGAALLDDARVVELHGSVAEAVARYDAAVAAAELSGEDAVLAEALRRRAIVRHRQGDTLRARIDCRRAYGLARALGLDRLAAEALNTLGGLELTTGFVEDARRSFVRALELGGAGASLRARVEQNLGILANIQGETDEALLRYRRSLEAYQSCGDSHGAAIAYNNLGMVSADRGHLAEAEGYFGRCLALAERVGDRHLQGLCLVNHAEVDVARQRFEDARTRAEAALALFEELGAVDAKADAYRVLGTIYRETGRTALGEARLRTAVELAASARSVLGEAEARRELAWLCRASDRNQEALRLLNDAYRLFRRLEARVDLVHVGGKVAELEATYLAVVREWGRSIELKDSETYGHSERVAQHAVALARRLGLSEHDETTILLGAYLHDLGKLRVPEEILAKPGALTGEERGVVRMHPLWGVELLADVEFPWDLKPIIRWHHERCDGSGYPDGLRGGQIPLAAQIVGIVEAYDALITPTSWQPALPVDLALACLGACRSWWAPPVLDGFLRLMSDRDARPEVRTLRSGSAATSSCGPVSRTVSRNRAAESPRRTD
jgi:putative nucleotidyltransferase with HDIG domain